MIAYIIAVHILSRNCCCQESLGPPIHIRCHLQNSMCALDINLFVTAQRSPQLLLNAGIVRSIPKLIGHPSSNIYAIIFFIIGLRNYCIKFTRDRAWLEFGLIDLATRSCVSIMAWSKMRSTRLFTAIFCSRSGRGLN